MSMRDVTLQVHEYFFRDGRMQNPVKDLRESNLKKIIIASIFAKHSILNEYVFGFRYVGFQNIQVLTIWQGSEFPESHEVYPFS